MGLFAAVFIDFACYISRIYSRFVSAHFRPARHKGCTADHRRGWSAGQAGLARRHWGGCHVGELRPGLDSDEAEELWLLRPGLLNTGQAGDEASSFLKT